MPKAKPYAKEADLCAAFVAALKEGWTAYAETSGYDLLLVRAEDGFQIGVEAKLRLVPFVLAQALDESRYAVTSSGPDCRAVLVPAGEVSVGLGFLAPYVGLTIITMRSPENRRPFEPDLPVLGADWSEHRWFEWAPTARCKLPDYVPDVVGGKPSPVQLTGWKIGALKIMALIDVNGFVTRADFRVVGIDHRRWMSPGAEWLVIRDGKMMPGPRCPPFREQHPVVYEQVKADVEKWAAKRLV